MKRKKLEENRSFTTQYPTYIKNEVQESWVAIKPVLESYGIHCKLNPVEMSMTVSGNDKKISKAACLLKLISRNVPANKAVEILQRKTKCCIINTGVLLQQEGILIQRMKLLMGPHSSTLKALQIVTKGYIRVQRRTVVAIGPRKAIKKIIKIVRDCIENSIHPLHHIKIIMMKKVLSSCPDLEKEDWERFLSFLPHKQRTYPYYFSWRKRRPEILEFPLLNQKKDICWAIALIRVLSARLKQLRLLDAKLFLSIQYLLNEIEEKELSSSGACYDLEPPLKKLLDGIVLESECPLTYELGSHNILNPVHKKYKAINYKHHQIESFEKEEVFDAVMEAALVEGPVVATIKCYPSYDLINGKEIYYPTTEELRSDGKDVPLHTMMCTGYGYDKNGKAYWEFQDSRGCLWGDGGYVRIARSNTHLKLNTLVVEFAELKVE